MENIFELQCERYTLAQNKPSSILFLTFHQMPKTILVKIKPVIDSITITQDKLNLSDEEMQNEVALKEYVQMYRTPYWFEVTEIIYQ